LYGWPYYGWSAGYNASKHDRLYTELFESKDPWKVYHLLKENGISYVAYDNAVRQGQFIKRPNQELYATYFPKVFEDNRYNGLIIYKIPDVPPPKLSSVPEGVINILDRKSTRLNSSHVSISYAVFCLKKKNKKYMRPSRRTGRTRSRRAICRSAWR